MLGRMFNKWATKTHKKELEEFTFNLSNMSYDERGLLLAYVTDMRNNCKAFTDLLYPSIAMTDHPYLPMTFNKSIRELQKQGNEVAAAAIMVWLHTIRAAGTLELRNLGRKMWVELMKGAAHVEAYRDFPSTMSPDLPLRIRGYESIPDGFEPLDK